jgi:hypothetical protein
MIRRRYSLRVLFVAVTLSCFMAWAVASPSVVSCVSVVIVWSLVGAVWGRRCADHPVGYGVAAGAVAVIAFIACFWTLHLGGYLFYDGPEEEYFEDGLVFEGFVFPVVYCFVYAPLGAMAGHWVGVAVWLVGDLAGRPARAERTEGRVGPPSAANPTR